MILFSICASDRAFAKDSVFSMLQGKHFYILEFPQSSAPEVLPGDKVDVVATDREIKSPIVHQGIVASVGKKLVKSSGPMELQDKMDNSLPIVLI